MSTGKPQIFKPIFLKNVILQLLVFKNLRQNLLGQFQSAYSQNRSSKTALIRVRDVKAEAEAVKFLWERKRKRFDERGWKQKRTRKRKC